MVHDYNHPANEALVRNFAHANQWDDAFDTLAQPLHVALYEAQSFNLLEKWSTIEQLILSLDYVQMHVRQGGFIQLIQNGYVSLLVNVVEALQKLAMASEMQEVLDNALKVFVLNNAVLSRETTPQEFARLYTEFGEFNSLDKTFLQQLPILLQIIVNRVIG